jgi:hypothetical protein
MVRLVGSMHVEICLLNCMRDVRASQSEVLKSTCKASILGGVYNKGTIIG